jgi:transcriptional regulator with PAS, ATPase and Fis domain
MPFISVNCGAITETLMEAELFGYERGAFTGAHQRRKGLFAAAHNGTIFLDEIAEMSTASQVKLLRVLQEGAVRPVGAHSEIQIDVRVIAATNRNLAREVSAGRFREDLFYRIAVLAINTPPLRDRKSDIPLLMQYFQQQAEQKIKSPMPRKVEDDAVDALVDYSWPGNVRQLRHVVEKLVVGTLGDSLINQDPKTAWAPEADAYNQRYRRATRSFAGCQVLEFPSAGYAPAPGRQASRFPPNAG